MGRTCERAGHSRVRSGRGVAGAWLSGQKGSRPPHPVARAPAQTSCPPSSGARAPKPCLASFRFTSPHLTSPRVFASPSVASSPQPRVMPRLPVVCVLPRRRVTLLVLQPVLQPGQRLVHSAPPRQRPASTIVSWVPPAGAAQAGRDGRERVAEAGRTRPPLGWEASVAGPQLEGSEARWGAGAASR